MNFISGRTALIGHTGFVGSNLADQLPFTDKFNSSNIADIAGQSFDTVVCAGVQAVKWWAVKHPEEDWAKIETLLTPLRTVQAKRFILISTIDVYPTPLLVNEDDQPSLQNHAYGAHRLKVEQFISEGFPVHHIVRLPGLFGAGLKKNVIFDLMHDNCLEMIQPESAFQYYNLAHLSADLAKVVEANIPLINFATEPVQTRAIIEAFAAGKNVGEKAGAVGKYDFRTKHSQLWGRDDGYLYDKATVLREIGEFMTAGAHV